MIYALTYRLPQQLRNEISLAIKQAEQSNNLSALRHCPGIVYACDAQQSHEYFCVYCAEGRVFIRQASLHRYFRHQGDSCIQNEDLMDTAEITRGDVFCG